MTAWSLLQTSDFQRLRRIKQLGVSEFVYPSATHTRFAHSIGVFRNARRLVRIIKREIDLKRVEGEFDPHRADTAVLAALLHDIGHGPFSHAFEEARKSLAEEQGGGAARAKIRKHESFTAAMVEDPDGAIAPILMEAKVAPNEVADLIRAETPTDMYHAVVSSSFDADRLDYLERDRYMTGVGAGAIDIEWLMDNVRVAEIDMSPADAGKDAIYRHSFCLLYKARDAAEDFCSRVIDCIQTSICTKPRGELSNLLVRCFERLLTSWPRDLRSSAWTLKVRSCNFSRRAERRSRTTVF